MTVRQRKQAELVLVEDDGNEPGRIEPEQETYRVGLWYWYLDCEEDKPKRIVCVVHVGSNFVKLEAVSGWEVRVHLDCADDYLSPELAWRDYLAGRVDHYRRKVHGLLREVQELTARLCVAPRTPIAAEPEGYVLAKHCGDANANAYTTALVKAKDVELPELFKKIKKANEKMATWLAAEAIPMRAQAAGLDKLVAGIEGRIFNVELYAGLTEEVEQIQEGEPASYGERLRVFQRMLYMDEECLLDYRAGGMEFGDVERFDRWLCQPKNLNRILPYPRCMVAMEVRRNVKERYSVGPLDDWINFKTAEWDNVTFLFIRNGDQVYRMGCDFDFDDLIFPGREEVDFSEPMMAHVDREKVESFMTVREYEELCRKSRAKKRRRKKWERENPKVRWMQTEWARVAAIQNDPKKWKRKNSRTEWIEDWFQRRAWKNANPHGQGSLFHEDNDYEPFNQDSLYFDEAVEEVETRVRYWNRVALIIQGLFDRSEILHPHAPARTWDPVGFAEAVELIYDGTGLLYDGDPPDFKGYRDHGRSMIDANSVLIGQDDVWQRAEAVKQNARRDRDWRSNQRYGDRHVERFQPYGNTGPGYLARPARWIKRARKARFEWTRERMRCGPDSRIKCSIVVPVDKLFNVSSYRRGDFLQFFQDPRTRRQYLRWAPFLLTAEEFHAGNLKARQPGSY